MNSKENVLNLYQQGKREQTPEGVSQNKFRKSIRTWKRTEDTKDPEILKQKSENKDWSIEYKYYLIAQVLAENSISSVAIEAGINTRLFNGLTNMKKWGMKMIKYECPIGGEDETLTPIL